jgi:hypothetical protein
MPRYFFDVHDGERHSLDQSGIELPSVAHVWEIAVPMVDEIVRVEHEGLPSQTVSVVVRDVCDVVVYRSEFVGR